MIHMKRLYQYEDDEGTWFEERSPLTEEEMLRYGIVYKGHTWVEEEQDENERIYRKSRNVRVSS